MSRVARFAIVFSTVLILAANAVAVKVGDQTTEGALLVRLSA